MRKKRLPAHNGPHGSPVDCSDASTLVDESGQVFRLAYQTQNGPVAFEARGSDAISQVRQAAVQIALIAGGAYLLGKLIDSFRNN